MYNFTKVVRIGQKEGGGMRYSVFCKIKFEDSRLSVIGVEGPRHDGNSIGGCGQIAIWPDQFKSFAPGWNAELAHKFADVWDRWHMNDCRAGSPRQEKWLRENKEKFPGYPDDYYVWATSQLASAGINPDMEYKPEYGKSGYKYGQAWLFEEVPAEVLEFLMSLPDTDRAPAWI